MNDICTCGKVHKTSVKRVISESGAIHKIAECVRELGGKKPFVLADGNTYRAAGAKTEQVLQEHGFSPCSYVFANETIEPDETSVGAAVMRYKSECDVLIGVGSGVVNDIGKLLSQTAQRPYIIVATAPSMDGYASATSSMAMDGLKISLPSRCPDVIIGDTEILKEAPMRMLQAGLGDMLAKYISICEWRIAHLLVGEYYCEHVVDMVRQALQKCVQNAEGLLKRDSRAVQAVFDGLVMGGMAMEYAGVSRPASGVEHYISHVWDMRGQAFGTKTDLHGIQCAVATCIAARIYEQLKHYKPNSQKALAYVQSFQTEAWHRQLSAFIGRGAEAMIALEEKEQKYSVEKHKTRLAHIIDHWDAIVRVIDEEVPPAAEIERVLDRIGAPKSCEEIGLSRDILPMTFAAAKDIRDKYVLPRLCWDLGILDEVQFDA